METHKPSLKSPKEILFVEQTFRGGLKPYRFLNGKFDYSSNVVCFDVKYAAQ
jgi:hypothetical protein